jgi:hypothetical protein
MATSESPLSEGARRRLGLPLRPAPVTVTRYSDGGATMHRSARSNRGQTVQFTAEEWAVIMHAAKEQIIEEWMNA